MNFTISGLTPLFFPEPLWIDIGVLQALRIGKNYKVSLDSLRRYLESQLDR